jgi:peptide-methionine (S)-S-oxide reductase
MFQSLATLCIMWMSLATFNLDPNSQNPMNSSNEQTVTLGAGCFWCVEAVFQSIPGVISAVSGYSGGNIKNPGYREVCTGRTGHAEVVQVTFDADIVPLDLVLDVFFATHDPTTLNRQGADVGTQYRSAIYFHEESHKAIAEAALLRAQSDWGNPIVTEITAFEVFYPAEDYHQAYYELNQEAPYCRAVIAPKMAKFRKEFAAKLNLE